MSDQQEQAVQRHRPSSGTDSDMATPENNDVQKAPPQDAPEHQYPGIAKLSLTLVALCISVFLVALDQTIIAPALGAITGHFHSTKDIVSRFELPHNVIIL